MVSSITFLISLYGHHVVLPYSFLHKYHSLLGYSPLLGAHNVTITEEQDQFTLYLVSLSLLTGSQKKYGREIDMRGAVEAAICEHYQDNYNIPDGDMCRLPMICILVEGGPNSISTCVATIRNGNFLTL